MAARRAQLLRRTRLSPEPQPHPTPLQFLTGSEMLKPAASGATKRAAEMQIPGGWSDRTAGRDLV